MISLRSPCWLAAIVLALVPVAARAQGDGQAWVAAVAQGTVSGDLFRFAEGQWRLTDDASRTGQIILRPAAGIRFAPDSTLVAGYALIRSTPASGATTTEHRLWQQLQLPLLRDDQGRQLLISRTRLEQRMLAGGDRTALRLRQMLRLQLPIRADGAVSLVGQIEHFHNLNSAGWGPRGGADQLRGFAGVGLPLGERIRIEPGYLHQRIIRPGQDRGNHVVSATLFYRL